MPRRTDLPPIRDKRLIEVYHYLSDIQRMRSDDVLHIMEQELFFVDAKYIYKVIFYNKQNQSYYEQLLAKGTAKEPVILKINKAVNQLKLGL